MSVAYFLILPFVKLYTSGVDDIEYIYPLLLEILPEDDCYEQASSLIKVLSDVLEADIEDEIPPISIIREFIGGNSFYK